MDKKEILKKSRNNRAANNQDVVSNSLLERKTFRCFPKVLCTCGYFLKEQHNFLECEKSYCENYGKRFKLPDIQLEEF